MTAARSIVLATILVAPLPAAAQGSPPLRIEHRAPRCVLPDRYPELRARIEPISQVLRARVLFRTDPMAEPHAVTMDQEGQEFVAVLPKPLATLQEVTYWVEAADPALAESVSDEVTVPVQPACEQPAKARKSARAEVTAPVGAPAVPDGFAADKAAAEDASGGTRRAGVFKIGPAASLIAALAVGGGAVALAASKGGEGNPPPRAQEPPGISLIDSNPRPGSVVRAGIPGLRLDIRFVPPENMGGNMEAVMLASPGGPPCATSARTSETFLAGIGRNVSLQGVFVTGACGATFDVTAVRIQLLGFASGRVLYGTGSAELPDLPLNYRVTP